LLAVTVTHVTLLFLKMVHRTAQC